MKMLRTTQSQNKINILFQLWRRYDADNSGYIEADELKVGRSLGLVGCCHGLNNNKGPSIKDIRTEGKGGGQRLA